MKDKKNVVKIILRVLMAWTFLWPFMDKLWGLGFATTPENAWLAGVSPTTGFLKFGSKGPFVEFFQSLAGNVFVDWLFMLGLLFIGLALLLGVGMRIAAYSGTLLLTLMWLATFPPEHNPFLDEHLIYAAVLFGLYLSNAGDVWGFGKKWAKYPLVKKFPILK